VINQWLISNESGNVYDYCEGQKPHADEAVTRLEPKSLTLLTILATSQNEVVNKEDIIRQLSPSGVMSDEALIRSISRLRKALHDDPKAPAIIETIPKRGYKLIAANKQWISFENESNAALNVNAKSTQNKHTRSIALVALAAIFIVTVTISFYLPYTTVQSDANVTSLEQADNFYAKMTRQGNENAYALYQNTIANEPNSARAHAGLANSLVQQVIRWQQPNAPRDSLREAIEQGITTTEQAKKRLSRAYQLASRAVAIAPKSSDAHKALGFVYSAQGAYKLAQKSYQTALEIDSNNWAVHINLGELMEIQGNLRTALPNYENAFHSMASVYRDQSAKVQPWYDNLSATIATKPKYPGPKRLSLSLMAMPDSSMCASSILDNSFRLLNFSCIAVLFSRNSVI